MCGKPFYGSYTIMPGRVPIYEHSPYRPKTTKLVSQQLRRAIYLDPSVLATTSTLTPATLANPSSTQGFLVFIRHPELNSRNAISSSTQGMYVLNPIPRSTQRICSELNSTNVTILPLRHHQKPCRSPYKVQYLGLTEAKSPSGGHVPKIKELSDQDTQNIFLSFSFS